MPLCGARCAPGRASRPGPTIMPASCRCSRIGTPGFRAFSSRDGAAEGEGNMDGARLIGFGGKAPRLDPAAFVAPGAVLIGDVEIGAEASIWYNCVLRGDGNRIRIGARSNVQDGSVIHVDPPGPGRPDGGFPTIIREDVLIGHMAMVHGC